MLTNIDYEQAIALLTENVGHTQTKSVPLSLSYGRVLAEDVCAKWNVPLFDRSPYDGYAIRSVDVASACEASPVVLQITEEIPAGKTATIALTNGTAAKILTGAPIPDGADAVVMFEKTTFTETTVTISEAVKSGSNIVRAGEDIKKGEVLGSAGTQIDIGLMGSLAAQGIEQVKVFEKPVVGLISTGSELIGQGMPLSPGKIYDSNQYTFLAALQKLGCESIAYGIAGDDVDTICALIQRAKKECDLVILTGGVSVGDYDYTPAAMEKAGAQLLFQRCDIKPGMACAYGLIGDTLICGLSGNPASSITNFELLVKPVIKKLSGQKDYLHSEMIVELAEDFTKKSPTTRIVRGRLDLSDGTVKMHLPKDQGNVVLSSTIGWNVIGIIPAKTGPVSAGTKLKGILI